MKWRSKAVSLVVWWNSNLIIKPNQSTLRINGDTMTISTVKQGEFNDYIRLSGTVQPLVTIQISPVEGGIVQEILIEEGSTVKKGDEILRLMIILISRFSTLKPNWPRKRTSYATRRYKWSRIDST